MFLIFFLEKWFYSGLFKSNSGDDKHEVSNGT